MKPRITKARRAVWQARNARKRLPEHAYVARRDAMTKQLASEIRPVRFVSHSEQVKP